MNALVPARTLLALLLIGLTAIFAVGRGHAADAVTYTRTGSTYEDVRLDLEGAIVKEGLKLDYSGNIAAMLQRTGPDVG